MIYDILTLFPEMFDSFLDASILGKAIAQGTLQVRRHNIRDFATGRHRVTDDAPYGGGCGMVMKPEPLVRAIESVRALEGPPGFVVLLTPQGRRFCQKIAADLARKERLILVCGRYEGVDERVRELAVDEEISIGDYVLSGGEAAALVVLDATARLVPGVLGDEQSVREESFSGGLLEYPQYTRPRQFMGLGVPAVLLSGDHRKIALWRRRKSLERTLRRRPDLLSEASLTEEDRKCLREIAERFEKEQGFPGPQERPAQLRPGRDGGGGPEAPCS